MAMTAQDVIDQDKRAILTMIQHYENLGDEKKVALYRSLLSEEED